MNTPHQTAHQSSDVLIRLGRFIAVAPSLETSTDMAANPRLRSVPVSLLLTASTSRPLAPGILLMHYDYLVR
ncbi:hypothetical protein [Planctomicrobium sp. SH664]|uniref:hypothetical protein n=1 Tax=Planctomicrobium sp. SH664 TaxID=3448125 RepID=UPI003F5C0B5C